LVNRITTYQTTRSETYLNRILGEIEVCRMFLIQLKALAERNIPLIAIYLSEPLDFRRISGCNSSRRYGVILQ